MKPDKKGLTAAELKRALKPLGKIGVAEHGPECCWVCVWVKGKGRSNSMNDSLFLQGPYAPTPVEARAAFLDALRWLQDKGRRV